MRGWILISVLTLAGCGEHLGLNPNYRFGASPYGQYLAEREAALVSGGAAPAVIPVARPIESPSAEAIAGRSPVPRPATMGVARQGRAAGSRPVAAADPAPIAAPLTANEAPYPRSVPVLLRYARSSNHAPGASIYPRAAGSPAQAQRICADYQGAEAAQIAFLAAGGPQTDTRGMDPDGDGFVCGWDPRSLRQ